MNDIEAPKLPTGQITDHESLHGLPIGSIGTDANGDVCERFPGGWRVLVKEPGGDPWLSGTCEVDDIVLPFTLFQPASADTHNALHVASLVEMVRRTGSKGGTVQLGGVLIQSCDEFGQTSDMRRAEVGKHAIEQEAYRRAQKQGRDRIKAVEMKLAKIERMAKSKIVGKHRHLIDPREIFKLLGVEDRD